MRRKGFFLEERARARFQIPAVADRTGGDVRRGEREGARQREARRGEMRREREKGERITEERGETQENMFDKRKE